MNIFGHVDKHGYFIVDDEGNELYCAGNHPYDSQQGASEDIALSVETLLDFCIQTGEEMAQERGDVFVGATIEEE